MTEYLITDPSVEYLSTSQAAAIVPGRPHNATIFRWMQRGIKGHKLQSWSIGGKRFTSRAAVETFLESLNSKPSSTPSSPSKSRQRAIESAEKELAELGM